MAANEKFVVSNCLCFAVNKAHYLANKPFKSLLMDFYTAEELADAKTLLLTEIDALKLANFPKIVRRRRDSNGRNALDIDDIMAAITFMDENQLLAKLPTFVSNHPDKMPASRLVEGDFSIIWTKMSTLEELISKAVNANLQTNDILKQNSDIIRSLSVEVKAISTAINDSHTGRCAATCNDTVDFEQCRSKSKETGASAGRLTGVSLSDALPTTTVIHKSATTVNNVVNATGTHTTRSRNTWGSIASVPHNDGDSDNDFEAVTSKAQRRADKRKERSSPSEQLHCNITGNPPKRVNDGSSMHVNEAAALANNVVASVRRELNTANKSTRSVVVSPSGRTSIKLTGQRSFSTLKAAERKTTELAVFCISNVGVNYTVNDIRSHSASLGARARYCFEITSVSSDARSFKLAVASTDANLITDEQSWPHRVVVRTWTFKNNVPTGSSADFPYITSRSRGVGGGGESLPSVSVTASYASGISTVSAFASQPLPAAVLNTSSTSATAKACQLTVSADDVHTVADMHVLADVHAAADPLRITGDMSISERGSGKEAEGVGKANESNEEGCDVGGREEEEENFMESVDSQPVSCEGAVTEVFREITVAASRVSQTALDKPSLSKASCASPTA